MGPVCNGFWEMLSFELMKSFCQLWPSLWAVSVSQPHLKHSDELAMPVTVEAHLLLENPSTEKNKVPLQYCFYFCCLLLQNLKMTALPSLLSECENVRVGMHGFKSIPTQDWFLLEKSEKTCKLRILFFFVLWESWLCGWAAVWENVLKCESRTETLSLSAARAAQLFTQVLVWNFDGFFFFL